MVKVATSVQLFPFWMESKKSQLCISFNPEKWKLKLPINYPDFKFEKERVIQILFAIGK